MRPALLAALLVGCAGGRATGDDSDRPRGGGDGADTLANHDGACDAPTLVYAAAADLGYRVAARLVPGEVPFIVEALSVEVDVGTSPETDVTCAAGSPLVEVWVGRGASPEASPTPAFSEAVAAADDGYGSWSVDVTLDDAVTLEELDSLFVSVELTGTEGAPGCVAACGDDPATDRNWWSGAATAPFAWDTLATHAADADLLVRADGRVVGTPVDPGGDDPY